MRLGSFEYWESYTRKNEEVKPRYIDQIRNLQSKLERGTTIIKPGHRVKKFNPDAICVEVPLSQQQRERLKWNLKVLIFRLAEGRGGALGYALPNHLHQDNPQRPDPYPAWDYNKPLEAEQQQPTSNFWRNIIDSDFFEGTDTD